MTKLKEGDKKIMTQGLDIGLTCSAVELKPGGSVLVRINGTKRETNVAYFELNDKSLGIINGLETLKLMRYFDECQSERIKELEDENNKLNSRIAKLLDAKY